MSHLMGEWLVAAIVSDIQKVIDGTIPFGKELASNSYVQDTGSGFRVVSQGRGPKLVQISKLHYQNKGKVTAGTISDAHVALHARFSDEAIRRYNETDPSHKGRRPITGYIQLNNFELHISRHGDIDQRIFLVIRDFSTRGGKINEAVPTISLAQHPVVKEVVGQLLERKPSQHSTHVERPTLPSQGKAAIEMDDSDDEPRSQVMESPKNIHSQDRFATQAKAQAKLRKSGGINLSGPKEALKAAETHGKGTTQDQLLGLLRNNPQKQATADDVPQPTGNVRSQGPLSPDLHPRITIGNSASLHNGTFLFARAIPKHMLEIPSDQAELLSQEKSWRSSQPDHTASGLNIPKDTLVALKSTRKQQQSPMGGSQQVDSLEGKISSQQSRQSEDFGIASNSSESEKLPWSDNSDHEMTTESKDPKDYLPPDSSLDSGRPSSPIVVAARLKQSVDNPPSTPMTNKSNKNNISSSSPDKALQLGTSSPSVPLSVGRINAVPPPHNSGMQSHVSTSDLNSNAYGLRTSIDIGIANRATTVTASFSKYTSGYPKEREPISLDSTDLSARGESGATHPTQSSRPIVSLDGGFDHSGPRSSRSEVKSSAKQASQTFRPPSLSHGVHSPDIRHKTSRPLSSQGETQFPAKRQRLEEQLPTSSPVHPAEVLRQQRRDFASTRKSERQQLHDAAQPMRPTRREVDSNTDCIQVMGRTEVEPPKKQPVVVINSPVKSPSRKAMQKPSTKPQHKVPRCLPCKSTHKPCEGDGINSDGPCKRCAKLGLSCKLTDDTTRNRTTTTASTEGVSLSQRKYSQTEQSPSSARSQHHASLRSKSSRVTSPASSIPRQEDDSRIQPIPIPIGNSKGDDCPIPQPSSSTQPPHEVALYNRFKRLYPDYLGDQKHFLGRCRAIEQLHAQGKLHKSLWDDHLIRHKTEYGPYTARCNDAGDELCSYEQYYNEACDAPKYTAMLLKPDTLKAALSISSTSVLGPTDLVAAKAPAETAKAPANVSNARGWQPPRQSSNVTDPRSVYSHASKHFGTDSKARHSSVWRDAQYRAQDSDRYEDPSGYRDQYDYNDRHRRETFYQEASRPASHHSHRASFDADPRDQYYRSDARSPYYRPHDRRDSSLHASRPYIDTYRPATGLRTSAQITPTKAAPERGDNSLREVAQISSTLRSMPSSTDVRAPQPSSRVVTPPMTMGGQKAASPLSRGTTGGRDDRQHATLPVASLRDQSWRGPSSIQQTFSTHNRTPTTHMNVLQETPRAVAGGEKTLDGPPKAPRAMVPAPATVLANNGVQRKPMPEQFKVSRSPRSSQPGNRISNMILDDNREDEVEIISNASDVGPASGALEEWWRKDNTVFKEFSRSFIGLKAFGGDLSKHAQGRIDVLDWQL